MHRLEIAAHSGCAHDPAGGDPVIQPDPCAIIPAPSVVYDNIYEAAKNNGREYDWWTVTRTPCAQDRAKHVKNRIK